MKFKKKTIFPSLTLGGGVSVLETTDPVLNEHMMSHNCGGVFMPKIKPVDEPKHDIDLDLLTSGVLQSKASDVEKLYADCMQKIHEAGELNVNQKKYIGDLEKSNASLVIKLSDMQNECDRLRAENSIKSAGLAPKHLVRGICI